MSDVPKVGEMVKVSQIGRVAVFQIADRTFCIEDKAGRISQWWSVDDPSVYLETVAEPLKVGDEIRWGIDPEPPAESILRSTSGVVATRSGHQAWYVAGHGKPYFWDGVESPNLSWTVVWLP